MLAVPLLFALNGAVFLAWGSRRLRPWLLKHVTISHYGVFVARRWWTLLTPCFSHESFSHLASNMAALHTFGYPLSKIIGSKGFLVLYLVGGILSNFAWLSGSAKRSAVCCLGASGSVAALVSMLCAVRPGLVFAVGAGGLEVPAIVYALVYLYMEYVSSRTNHSDGIAHTAHWSGALVGLVAGLLYRRWSGEGLGAALWRMLHLFDLEMALELIKTLRGR
jgi:membrane associated rhomboid family serine protease